nr:hypothetical protein [uncultured Pedobacter sp.]
MENPDKNKEALILIHQTLDLGEGFDKKSEEELAGVLAKYLDELIVEDFNKLIAILYRIDVSEQKAIMALANNTKKENAGKIIAQLIIDRQKEKLYYRNLYRK